MKMIPAFARFDATNGVFPNAIVCCYLSLQPRISKNGAHLRFGKFGSSATLSTIGSSMFGAVKLIVARRIPSQIIKSIVKRISVIVTSLHAFWARTNECFKYGFMRVNDANFVVSPKTNKWSAFLLIVRVSLQFACAWITNAAFCRYLVQTFISNNRKPSFHKTSHLLLMGILA